jgi:hypothetical protein
LFEIHHSLIVGVVLPASVPEDGMNVGIMLPCKGGIHFSIPVGKKIYRDRFREYEADRCRPSIFFFCCFYVISRNLNSASNLTGGKSRKGRMTHKEFARHITHQYLMLEQTYTLSD